MRALLLAGGYGTRLRPLTNKIPKCLVPIRGTPLLALWLRRLTEAGIGPFLINTHYLAETVEAFVKADPHQDQIKLVYEEALRGTAGTLLENVDFFNGEDGLLIHADNYCFADMRAFAEAHASRPNGCLMTMMTFRTANPSACGIVEVDERGVVRGFHEKVSNPPGNLANGAIYILSHEMIGTLKKDFSSAVDFSNEILKLFIGQIFTYETSEIFLDIGTPESYAQANS